MISDHQIPPAAAGAQPALPEDPFPHPVRAGRPGGQDWPDTDSGNNAVVVVRGVLFLL